MSRPPGVRDKDYGQKREALVRRIRLHLVASLPRKPSFRDLALAAGVSLPTLRHYFGSRDGAIAAALMDAGRGGVPYLAYVADASLPFDRSIPALADFILQGLVAARVVDLHAIGLAEGTASEALGPVYLEHLLEPTLQSVEQRLAAHQARGEMQAGDVRAAAVMLVSPLLLAALHQAGLGGDRVRPLDLIAFGRETALRFVRAWRT